MKQTRLLVLCATAGALTLAHAWASAESVKPRPSATATAIQAPAPLSTAGLWSHRSVVRLATVTLRPASCAGFAIGPRRVVTAAHCVAESREAMEVHTAMGQSAKASLQYVDRDADIALLRLRRSLRVRPLRLAPDAVKPGDTLLFAGRPDRSTKQQLVEVSKLDTCPSLPKVGDAVFTDLEARPGSSGAPLLNRQLQVVALVHGGARCHIAAPIAPLVEYLNHTSNPADDEAPQQPGAQGEDGTLPSTRGTMKGGGGPSEAEATSGDAKRAGKGEAKPSGKSGPTRTYTFGPFQLQETDHGYRVKWSFKLNLGF